MGRGFLVRAQMARSGALALKDSKVSRGSCFLGGAGTGGWTRISPVPLRCARICGLLWLGGVGLSEMRSHPRVAGRGVVREPADACVSRPRCAGTCSSAGSCRCICPASRTCAPICGLPCVVDRAAAAGTGRCVRISSALRRYAPICRFLRLRPFGIPDLRVYLRDPVLSALSPALAKRPLPGHRPWHRANPNTRHHTSPVA